VVHDAVGDDRRRAVPLGEGDVEAVAREDVRDVLREPLGGLPRVVADEDRRVAAGRREVVRDRLRDDANPLVGELRERGPPAVGPEADGVHTDGVNALAQ